MTDSKGSVVKGSVGMIGLAVMGSNLARNIARRGRKVAVYNREPEISEKFMQSFGNEGFIATSSLEQLVGSLERPRVIMMLIMAGKPVDQVLQALLPMLSAGDIVMDGGNSFFKDTERRVAEAALKGVHFMGVGVSGGSEGALNGPSLMPGGSQEAWKVVEPLLTAIAAQVEGPCCRYVGPGGSGHFVKMVHNGIEYGDMQLIAEAFSVLRDGVQCQYDEMSKLFGEWNEGPLSSFLIEITSKILATKDPSSKNSLVEMISDVARQKGTGKWTLDEALELQVPVPTLGLAVEARFMSAAQKEREALVGRFGKGNDNLGFTVSSSQKTELIKALHSALYSAKLIAYAQGMALLRAASAAYNWKLELGEIAALWRGGCIIRARFLGRVREAYRKNPELSSLLVDDFVAKEIESNLPGLRSIVAQGAQHGIALPCFSSSLAYFDTLRTKRLPQQLTQAQRDFFGSHTYQRVDKEGVFHFDWEGGKEEKVG